MSIAENIIKLRKIFDVTQRELGEVAGVSENAVSKWENGYSEPRMGAIEKIAACYGLKKINIIEDGGMDVVDPVTKKVTLPPNAIPVKAMPMARVPLLGIVHAGEPTDPVTFDYEYAMIPQFLLDSDPDCYALKVEGDCMDKVYPEGCTIVVSPNKEPVNGSIVAARIDEHDTVMRRMYRTAQTLVLSPDSYNPEHDDIVITYESGHIVEFVGKVVWFQSREEME